MSFSKIPVKYLMCAVIWINLNTTFECKGQGLLKFNRMYIYDNGKDTLIKNYAFYDSLLTILPIVPDSNAEENYVPMPGSTFIESIIFYNNDNGSRVFSRHRDWDKILNEHHSISKNDDKSDKLYNIKVTDNKISFQSGNPNEIMTFYVGTIINDTLNLSIRSTLNGREIEQGDPTFKFRQYVLNGRNQ